MQSINKYPTTADYTADASRRKGLKESTISLIEDVGEVKIEGYGVFVEKRFAKFGDIAVYDAAHGVRFIDHASLPATASETTTMLAKLGVTAVGVVFDNDGNKVYVVSSKSLGGYRWTEGLIVAIHGVSTANGGGFTLTYNDVAINITYNAGTLDSIATAVKSALDSCSLGAHWVVSVDGNDIIIAWHWYTPHINTVTISGTKSGERMTQITLDYQTTLVADVIGQDYPTYYVMRRNNYLCGWAGCHHERFLQYYRENGSEEKNQVVKHWGTLRESVFNEVDNPIVYEHYKGDYEAYIRNHLIMDPAHKGAMLDKSSKENTVLLAGAMYEDLHGEKKPIYPAAYACHHYDPLALGENSGTSIGLHDWVLPSFPLVKKLMEQTEIGGTDALNQTLVKLSGNHCRPESSYIWASTQYSAAYGYMNGYYKFSSLSVRAVSAF